MLLINPDDLRIWLSSSFVEFLHIDVLNLLFLWKANSKEKEVVENSVVLIAQDSGWERVNLFNLKDMVLVSIFNNRSIKRDETPFEVLCNSVVIIWFGIRVGELNVVSKYDEIATLFHKITNSSNEGVCDFSRRHNRQD